MIDISRFLRHLGASALVAALVSSVSSAAYAQGAQAVITGKVANEKGILVDGASISIPQFNQTVVVSANGTYRIAVVANGQIATVVARAVGKAPVSKDVTLSVGTQTLDFVLSATQLNTVVTTGTAEATDTKKLTIGVTKISSDQMSEVPNSNAIGNLQAKVSGVKVAGNRGTPGATPVIKIRGSTNLGIGNSTPMLVVDGIITTGSMQDIDGNDIESIEVLKGAASASSYGSSAANGVIAITTKRGKSGPNNKVTFTTRNEMGTGTQEHFVPIAQYNHYQKNADGSFVLNGTGTARVSTAALVNDQPFAPGTWRNQQKTWMRNGDYQNNYVNVGVRRGNTNLSTSYSFEHNAGILPFLDGERRTNIRLNMDQGITDKIDLSISATYGLNNNDQNVDSSGPFFALLQSPPDIDLRRPSGAADSVQFDPYIPTIYSNGTSRGNALYGLTVNDNKFRRDRVLGSGTVRYRPATWLTLDASYGTDRSNSNNTAFLPKGTFSSGAANTLVNGSYSSSYSRSTAANVQVNATISKQFGDLRSVSRFTYLDESAQTYNTAFLDSKLVFNLPTVNAGDALSYSFPSTNGQNQQTVIKAVDYFITQQLDWKDRYLAQVMVRRDGSSLFGSNSRYKTFYGVSGAYRVTEDFHIPGVQELKLRVAQGTAGLRPAFSNQYQSYSLSGGVATKSQLGNPDLRPAVQTETEYSINADFLDRFSIEITRADRLTKDAFLTVPLSSAKSGGYTGQVQNAADISAHTWELSLTTRVIDRPTFAWSFTVTGDRTKQAVDRLNRSAYNQAAAFGQAQGNQFWVRQGEALGVMYGARWVRSIAELSDNPANTAAKGFLASDYVVNELGYVVKAVAIRTTTELPIKYVDPTGNAVVKIGDINPDFTWGWTHDLRYKDIGLHILFDGVSGGQIYNFTKQWMFQDERHADQDQANVRPVSARKTVGFFSSGFYNGLDANDYFVEGGTYVKLRELSLNYTLPNRVRNALGLGRLTSGVKLAFIGRNLKTWTKYTGADPEQLGGGDFNYRIDGFAYPNLRQYSAQITVTY